MSKFIEAVRLSLTGQCRASRTRMQPIASTKEIRSCASRRQKEYCVTTSYARVGFCDKADLPYIEENFIRGLCEDVYGEFRHLIIRLERAVYEQEPEEMRSALRDLKTEVGL